MQAYLSGLKRIVGAALLYTALGVGANAADLAALEALRAGDMRLLVFAPRDAKAGEAGAESDDALPGFYTFDDTPIGLDAYEGKIVVLNFWATWCAPCRDEMPSLARLQRELAGEDFAVVTVATGHNPESAMTRFFESVDIDNLPLHRDPQQSLARAMDVSALPTTIVLDRERREIARLVGEADWSSESALSIFEALIDG